MSEPQDRRQPPGFEIPDLELPPPRASQSGTHTVRVEVPASPAAMRSSSGVRIPAAPSPSFPSMGPTLDFGDDEGLDTRGIQLEHEAEISQTGVLQHYGRSAGLTEDDLAPEVSEALRRSVPKVELHANWPSGTTPARERLLLDANDVRALADYGEPPGFFLLSPLYSLRVFFRRQALTAALATIERELADAESERDALVGALGDRLGPALARDATLARLVSGGRPPLDVGRAILAARGAIEVDGATLESVRQADERVRTLVVDSELHLRALDACDEDKVRLGHTCVGVLVMAALAIGIWRAL